MSCSIGSKGVTTEAARAVAITAMTTQAPKSAVRRRARRRRNVSHCGRGDEPTSWTGNTRSAVTMPQRNRMRGSR